MGNRVQRKVTICYGNEGVFSRSVSYDLPNITQYDKYTWFSGIQN